MREKRFQTSHYKCWTTNFAKRRNKKYDTVIIDDKDLAALLWDRIKGQLPEKFSSNEEDDTKAVGLSDHFRFYRYDKGQRFIRHYDGYEYGSMVYTNNQNKPQAKMTFLVYLNDQFEGGKTTFFNSKGKETLAVSPETGLALIYTQKLLHEGSLVTKGRKYVLRSDILFGKLSDSPPTEGWSCSLQ